MTMLTTSGPTTAAQTPNPWLKSLLTVLLGDLIAPVAATYAARSAGASTSVALVLGSATCLLRQIFEIARHRRLDWLGAAVLASFALGGALTLLSGDVRFVVLKDAVWPLAAGVVVAASMLRAKPVSFYVFRPMLTRGHAENRPFWDSVWADPAGAPFRRCLRVLAVGWTVVLLGSGIVEVVLAFALPLNAAAAAPVVIHVISLPTLLGFTALYAKNTGLGVRRSLEGTR